MSFAVDANLLLYALNSSSPEHPAAAKFLESAAEEDGLCLTWTVVNAFLRLSTSAQVMPRPLSPQAARAWLDDLINLPGTRLLAEEPGFWKLFCEVAGPLSPRGFDVTDTHLATVLKQHGVRLLYSHDKGFRRFEFLKVVDPIVRPA